MEKSPQNLLILAWCWYWVLDQCHLYLLHKHVLKSASKNDQSSGPFLSACPLKHNRKLIKLNI